MDDRGDKFPAADVIDGLMCSEDNIIIVKVCFVQGLVLDPNRSRIGNEKRAPIPDSHHLNLLHITVSV
jgi:hypothetical protein